MFHIFHQYEKKKHKKRFSIKIKQFFLYKKKTRFKKNIFFFAALTGRGWSQRSGRRCRAGKGPTR